LSKRSASIIENKKSLNKSDFKEKGIIKFNFINIEFEFSQEQAAKTYRNVSREQEHKSSSSHIVSAHAKSNSLFNYTKINLNTNNPNKNTIDKKIISSPNFNSSKPNNNRFVSNNNILVSSTTNKGVEVKTVKISSLRQYVHSQVPKNKIMNKLTNISTINMKSTSISNH
jgi:hypothetical protein